VSLLSKLQKQIVFEGGAVVSQSFGEDQFGINTTDLSLLVHLFTNELN
jgi:hypothetical protein